MLSTATVLVLCCVLTLLMLVLASTLKTRAWKAGGVARAFGNRDDLGEASPIAGRADRAARNMIENLAIFVALIVAVQLAGVKGSRVELGANIFFWARLAYWGAYVAGIPVIRTVIWGASIVGLALIAVAALRS